MGTVNNALTLGENFQKFYSKPIPKNNYQMWGITDIVFNEMIVSEEVKNAKELGQDILEAAKEQMKGYNVQTYFTFGYPAEEIINKAIDEDVGIIVMTQSTKRGLSRMIGSVTASVVKKAKCIVMVVPNDFSISLR